MLKLTFAILFAAAGSLAAGAENATKTVEPVSPIDTFTVDSTPLDRTNSHQFSSYAPMLAKVTPSIVTVSTSSMVRIMHSRGNDPMEELLRRYYGIAPENNSGSSNEGDSQIDALRKVPNGMGSGVIVTHDGYILTNNHVVCDSSGEAADEITVTLPDGREFKAKLVGRDPQTDVAVIKIDAKNLPIVPFGESDDVQVGDLVFAAGNPMGLSQSVSMGIVSAVGRSRLGILGERGYEDFIQTDAPINPGNSGGALVDAEGRLIGINTAILSRTGGSIGIGFAIPSSVARSVAINLMSGGKMERGYLGVTVRNLDATLAESFGIQSGRGSLIEGVTPGSPADKAGLKRGDVIVKVDGRNVLSDGDLRVHVAQKRPGTKVAMTYIRDGKSRDIEITLGNLSPDMMAGPGAMLVPGVVVQPVTEDLARKFGIEKPGGVVVTSVSDESPFGDFMLPGMQILEINDEEVDDPRQAKSLIKPGTVNRLWVVYKGKTGYIGIRVPAN
jgi:serine protease Do/serine protease DegQ